MTNEVTSTYFDCILRYVYYLSRLAAFMRNEIDDCLDLAAGLKPTAECSEKADAAIARFVQEAATLRTEYVAIRRNFMNLHPTGLLEARDVAFGRLRGKINIAVAGVRVAAVEYSQGGSFAELSISCRAHVEYCSGLTLNKQIEDFKELYDL